MHPAFTIVLETSIGPLKACSNWYGVSELSGGGGGLVGFGDLGLVLTLHFGAGIGLLLQGTALGIDLRRAINSTFLSM